MGPSDAVRSVLSQYAGFGGRASRSEYWWWIGATFALYLLMWVFIAIAPEIGSVLYAVVLLALIIPGLAVAVRRLHDTGRSGWWLLVAFIPIVGAIVLLIFLVLDSENAPNRWGLPPPGSRYHQPAMAPLPPPPTSPK